MNQFQKANINKDTKELKREYDYPKRFMKGTWYVGYKNTVWNCADAAFETGDYYEIFRGKPYNKFEFEWIKELTDDVRTTLPKLWVSNYGHEPRELNNWVGAARLIHDSRYHKGE